MNKERLILAIVGITAGLIVTSSIFIFYQHRSLPEKKEVTQNTITPIPNGKTTLELESPQDEDVVDTGTIEIKGKSQPNALIVLSTNTDDFVISADSNGNFVKKILLLDNANIISATAYSDNGTSETKDLIITYSTEEF